jgi:hypothetical protein
MLDTSQINNRLRQLQTEIRMLGAIIQTRYMNRENMVHNLDLEFGEEYNILFPLSRSMATIWEASITTYLIPDTASITIGLCNNMIDVDMPLGVRVNRSYVDIRHAIKGYTDKLLRIIPNGNCKLIMKITLVAEYER